MDDVVERRAAPEAVLVRVLDGFVVSRHGGRVELPTRAARLVACLAVRGGTIGRGIVAGHLWPDVTERQAATSLRSTLLAIRRPCPELLDTGPNHVGLAAGVKVDLADLVGWCRRAMDPADDPVPPPFSRCPRLLPEFDADDWITTDRESLHQLLMHALESVTGRFIDRGQYADAALAATCAVATDPLRESARHALIRVHLAEGNLAAALHEYDRFRRLLDQELGVAPTQSLRKLLAAATSAGQH
ncbi:BTAD domain-containing putative transcriptional regulator [Actinopolymorpha sp. NPDC004070]|uniref:AfsR/SARP family transcriptional regulator n=1 Tax=Actinopolymorpha sp. NPDC004070 TaxID=3154548 RepID=UPI0033B10705